MLVGDSGNTQGYSYRLLSVGKSPWLLPTERGRRRVAWHPLTGPFENSRAGKLMCCVFQYNHYFYLLYNISALVQLVSGREKRLKGLGSIPRSPILFHNILSCIIMRMYRPKDHHGPSPFNHQIAHNLDPQAITWRTMMHPGQLATLNQKSQTWTFAFGPQNYYWNPSNCWSPGPISLVLFFFFFYFLLFNYLDYFLT